MTTPTTDRFLQEIGNIIRQKDAIRLRDFLVIEPEFGPEYHVVINELRRHFPAVEGQQDEALERKCASFLQEASLGDGDATWGAFIKFMATYLAYLRDLKQENLWETFQLITGLINKCNAALIHATMGELMLPAAVVYCKLLAKIALGLDKQPELIADFIPVDDDQPVQTLAERAANTIRTVFVTCLTDRGTAVRDGRPVGKKAGVYIIANIVLKMLFQSKHIRTAEQIFTNIYNLSPPLRYYPSSQRVTYLYYLGRFLFANGHFLRAILPLQAAFDETPSQFTSQRRKIMIYLLASNMIIGRHPRSSVWQLPEARGFERHFIPLLTSIRMGDLESFRRVTNFDSEHAQWFLSHAILLPLRGRCIIHVYRSLLRRTFLLSGDPGDLETRRAPAVSIRNFHTLLRYLEFRSLSPLSVLDKGPGKRHTNFVFLESGSTGDLPQGYTPYIDKDFIGAHGVVQKPPPILPDLHEAESIVMSLITQNFVNGFISHKSYRLAIMGTKKAGGNPVKAGFPTIWEGVKKRVVDTREQVVIPGWKRDENEIEAQLRAYGINSVAENQGVAGPGGRKVGPGMVINLSGARPVGFG